MIHFAKQKRLIGMVLSMMVLVLAPRFTGASDRFKVDHPMIPPSTAFSEQCPVCGMLQSMWARTWIHFDEMDGVSEVCSFHCLADLSIKSDMIPGGIRLALYHAPETMVAANKASIVIGSAANGTMSPESKIVFATVQDAEAFIPLFGGKITSFGAALHVARTHVTRENAMLVKKRLRKGKIIEPAAVARCRVCDMFPSRYPKHKCQIQTGNGQIFHFCSTQCLFTFLENPKQYAAPGLESVLIWVTDFQSGKWTGARCAYYVTRATQVYGPMGFEAFPFDKKKDAQSFVDNHGGSILLYREMTREKIFPSRE